MLFQKSHAALGIAIPLLLIAAPNADDLLRQAELKISAEQFGEAEAILAAAVKLDPARTEPLYRLGYVHYRQRKLDAARSEFQKVVKTAPPAYYSRYFLGRIALLENKPGEAITWLEPIIDARESVFDTTSQLAAAYTAAAMPQKATRTLQAAIAEAPWDGSLYYRLGQAYSRSGNKELAAEAFETSKRIKNASREDVETLMETARLLGNGKQAEAVQTGLQVKNRTNADPNALVALGVLYGKANLAAEALDAFERAAQRDGSSFQAEYNRGLALLRLNRPSEALAPLSKAVQLLPQSVDANRTLGLAAVMLQRYSEAITPLSRAWQSDPSDLRVGALLATAQLRTGEPAKAADLLGRDAFKSSPEPAPMLLRIEALNAAEDQNGALAAADEARKRFPKLAQAQMAYAQQLARLGRYQEAQPAFAETLALAPGNPEAELGLADTLAKSGKHADAIAHYRATIATDRLFVVGSAGLARSLVALRQFEEARKLLEDGIAAHPAEASLRVELSRVYARLGMSDKATEQASIAERLRDQVARQ